MLKAFPKIQSDDDVQNRIQDNIAQTIAPIIAQPILGGNLLTGIVLVSGQDNIVNHKLGRKLQGWVVTRIVTDATVWDSQSLNPNYLQTLILNCSANTTLDLWVF